MTNHDEPAIGAVGEGIDRSPVLGNPDPYLDALVDVPQAECAVGSSRGQQPALRAEAQSPNLADAIGFPQHVPRPEGHTVALPQNDRLMDCLPVMAARGQDLAARVERETEHRVAMSDEARIVVCGGEEAGHDFPRGRPLQPGDPKDRDISAPVLDSISSHRE